MTSQVKSKKRVRDHGEVFTNEREVNAMLDLVKDETENIESTFLEPACGDGNFLSEIIRRKLSIVKDRYGKNLENYEKYSIVAISSIYGVELLKDNVTTCIERLYNIWNEEYLKVAKKQVDKDVQDACRYILRKNILCGDALTLKQENGEPIIFAEWKLVSGPMLKRRDYRLDQILEAQNDNPSLFWFADGWEYDEETKEYIPAPIKEFPLADFRRVQDYE